MPRLCVELVRTPCEMVPGTEHNSMKREIDVTEITGESNKNSYKFRQ